MTKLFLALALLLSLCAAAQAVPLAAFTVQPQVIWP